MIGIYKITNKINNKVYIGQAVDISRRWSYYKNPPQVLDYKSKIIDAIKKYGIENFIFEVIEECLVEELNEKEQYWISFYNSTVTGYNITTGGDHNVGSANPNALLTEEDVKLIRDLYNLKSNKTKADIYNEFFSEKCSFRAFEKVWNGETWTHIKPEVFTEENRNFYKTKAKSRKGEKNANSTLSDEEVMIIRERYVNETITEIWADYPQFTYSGFEKILLGSSYSHLPIYKKRLKKWIIK